MRNIFKKIIAFLIVLCISVFSITAYANDNAVIIVSSQTAKAGDKTDISLSINNNPGIMAITISVTYDSKALQYIDFSKDLLTDCSVTDYSDKGYLRIVCCESGDIYENGSLVTLQFRIKEAAESGFYEIGVDYSSGDFSNWDEDLIMPEIISGGITVPDDTCKHSFSDWNTVIEASCVTNGKVQRNCSLCGITEQNDTSPTGHNFSSDWTVDTPATESTDGSMSRHCDNCDTVTDIITFSSADAQEHSIPVNKGETVEENEFTQQYVGENEETSSSTEQEQPQSENSSAIEQEETKQNSNFIVYICLAIVVIFIVMILLYIKRKKSC